MKSSHLLVVILLLMASCSGIQNIQSHNRLLGIAEEYQRHEPSKVVKLKPCNVSVQSGVQHLKLSRVNMPQYVKSGNIKHGFDKKSVKIIAPPQDTLKKDSTIQSHECKTNFGDQALHLAISRIVPLYGLIVGIQYALRSQKDLKEGKTTENDALNGRIAIAIFLAPLILMLLLVGFLILLEMGWIF